MSWKILASGMVPEYLHESGLLDRGLPFPELQQRAHVNARAQAADTDPERYLLDHALTAAARFVMVAGRDRTGGRWVTNA